VISGGNSRFLSIELTNSHSGIGIYKSLLGSFQVSV